MNGSRARCRCPAPLVWLMVGLTWWQGQIRAGPVEVQPSTPTALPPGFAESSPAPSARPGPFAPLVAPALSYRPPAEDPFLTRLLAELAPGSEAAFALVRDQIAFDAYPGSLRGARGTLWSQAGNSLDQATLLLSLLHGQGIEARLARGLLGEADARALIHTLFDPAVAGSAVGYVPDRFPRYDPGRDPALLRWASDHWWVELADGTALDPTFPGTAPGETPARKTGVFDEVPAALRHQVVVRLLAELHNPLSGYTDSTPLEVTFNTADVYGRAITLGHFISVYQPPALVTGWKTYTYSPFFLIDDHDGDCMNDLVLRGDDYQEFLTGLFPLANSTLTRLTLEFEVRHPERAPDLRRRDLLDRVGFAARHGLTAPGPVDTSRPALSEFDLTTFYLTPGFIRGDILPPLQQALRTVGAELDVLAPRVTTLTNLGPASLTGEQTESINRYVQLNRAFLRTGSAIVTAAFLFDSDHLLRVMRQTHLSHAYYDSPRLTLFNSSLRQTATEASIRISLDLRRNHVQAIPYPDQNALNFFAFNQAKGSVDSALERAVLEEYFGDSLPGTLAAAGPLDVLRAAEIRGVPLVNLRTESDIPNRLEPLPLSPEAKARIVVALQSGHQVAVPDRMIDLDGQPAIGWWDLEVRTGELIAVGEDGGRQSLMEFGILLAVIGTGSALVLTVLGGNLDALLSTARERAKEYRPFGTDALGGATTGYQPSTRFDLEDGEVEVNADGSLTVGFDGEDVTIPAKALNNLNQVFGTHGAIDSITHFSGLPLEVRALYAPTVADFSGKVTKGDGLRLDTYLDPAFDVVHDASQLPSAYRARLTYTGAPAPRDAGSFRDHVGESFIFEVTGVASGTVWGTDLYTWDSPLATAAVHAGVVTPGATTTVKVTILPGQASYRGSTRNGVTSRDFGAYGASYRFAPIQTTVDQAVVALSGTAPTGWNLLVARATNTVPAAVTNEVSVFLQPQEGTPLPPPDTPVAWTLHAARTDLASTPAAASASPASGLTQDHVFILPEVRGLEAILEPTDLYTSPEGAVTARLSLRNTGNVTEALTLQLDPPPGFTLTGLPSALTLLPGEAASWTPAFTSHGVAIDTEHSTRLRVAFGPGEKDVKEVALRIHVSPPGALQALAAAQDADDLDRRGLGRTLQALGLDLGRLYSDPADDLLRARVLTDLEAVLWQFDDPVLSDLVPGLTAELDTLRGASPATLATAMEHLGISLTALADRLDVLADHDFAVVLEPNSATALPETPATFHLRLLNKGSRATTYTLSLSALPPGVTGGLDRTTLKLAPGELSAFAVAGVGETASVTLTPPADVLAAFEFSVLVAVEGAPDIQRRAPGSFVARQDLVRVLQVETAPAWIDPRPRTSVGTFSGGDEGEGLDLTGDFLFAVNLNATATSGPAGDASFAADDAPGVTVQANARDDHWQVLQYGDSPADDALELVMGTTRSSASDTLPVAIDLAGLTPGRRYRLQLLFTEARSDRRAFDVYAEDQLLLDDFNLAKAQGGVGLSDRGVVVTHEFTARDDTLNIALDGSHVANAAWTLHSPVISGLTLEALPGIQVAARVLNAVNADQDVDLQFTVRDPAGSVVHRSTPQSVRLTTRSSLDTFELGAFDLPATRLGPHPIEVAIRGSDGTPLPGAVGTGTLLVGAPISAEWSVTPESLPPGDGQVSTRLSIASALELTESGPTLIGLTDTPGRAQTLALLGDYAYVGGTEGVTVLDVSNPRDPRIVQRFGSSPLGTAATGSRLLVRNGFDLDVYGLSDPVHPALLATEPSGLQNLLIPDFRATDDLALMTTLVIGYDTGSGEVDLARGDLLAFDLRNPKAPRSMGLLFDTYHSELPEWPGSDFFLGLQSATKDDILFLPSSTAPGAADEGSGRLVLVDLATPEALSVAGELVVPETGVLLALAIQGDQALVLGDTGTLGPFGRDFTGSLTASVLDVANPRSPRVVATTTLSNAQERVYFSAATTRVIPGPQGLFLITGLETAGEPASLFVDTTRTPDIGFRSINLMEQVTAAAVRSNLLYTTSVDGLAIYDLGSWLGLPVVVRAILPRNVDTSAITDSFRPPPDDVLPSGEADEFLWHFTLVNAWTNPIISWTTDLKALQPGEARPITQAGEVGFSFWGTEAALTLPPLAVAGSQILALEPAQQTQRPGAPADYLLQIRNPSAEPVTYELIVQGLPSNWVSLVDHPEVEPGAEQNLPLRLISREDSPRGNHDFTIVARTADRLGMVQGTLTLEGPPKVNAPIHGLTVTLHPPRIDAARGTPAAVHVRIVNTGNVTEHCTLSVAAPQGLLSDNALPALDVPPGLENYRETALVLQPKQGQAIGPMPFAVTARSEGAEATMGGVLDVLPPDFELTLDPEAGNPGTEFVVRIANHAEVTETFDLQVAGSLAPTARLDPAAVTVTAGQASISLLTLESADMAHPGGLPLTVVTTARSDPRAQATASSLVEIPPHRELEAWFSPTRYGRLTPGRITAPLHLRNAGNVEETCQLEILTLEGAVSPRWRSSVNGTETVLPLLRLPALGTGVVQLEADLIDYGTCRVGIRARSLVEPEVQTEALALFQAGVILSIDRTPWPAQAVTRLHFMPMPDYRHTVEYRDVLAPDQRWDDLPDGPHNSGEVVDPAPSFERYYRVRLDPE